MQEEIAKRAARAKKFGLPEERQQPGYAPDPEDLKREARARKFGVKYEKPTADTVLQKAGKQFGSCVELVYISVVKSPFVNLCLTIYSACYHALNQILSTAYFL